MADGLYLDLETAVDNSISFYVCACFRLGHLDIIQILFHIVISSFYVLFFTRAWSEEIMVPLFRIMCWFGFFVLH